MNDLQRQIVADLTKAIMEDAIRSIKRRESLADLAGISDDDYHITVASGFLLLFLTIMQEAIPDMTKQQLYEIVKEQFKGGGRLYVPS